MSDLERDLAALAPVVDTEVGLDIVRSARGRRGRRRALIGVGATVVLVAGVGVVFSGSAGDREDAQIRGETVGAGEALATGCVFDPVVVESVGVAGIVLVNENDESCTAPRISAIARTVSGVESVVQSNSWDENPSATLPAVLGPGEGLTVVVHNRPSPCPAEPGGGYREVDVRVGAVVGESFAPTEGTWPSCGLSFTVLEGVVALDRPDPAPSAWPPCDGAAFAGVRTDGREWNVEAGAISYTLAVTEPCVLESLTVEGIRSDGASGRALPASEFLGDQSIDFPHVLLPSAPVRLEIVPQVVGPCGADVGELIGFSVTIGQFSAQAAPPRLGWCDAQFSLRPDQVPTATPHLSSIPPCDEASGLEHAGPFDSAGTPNTTFVNGGPAPCRIDDVDVVGVDMLNDSAHALGEFVDPPPGIPTSDIPAVLGPGDSLAVVIVTAGGSCESSPATVAEFTITVGGIGQTLSDDRQYQLCATNYTATLRQGSSVGVTPAQFVDLDGRVCLLSNPAQCEPWPFPGAS